MDDHKTVLEDGQCVGVSSARNTDTVRMAMGHVMTHTEVLGDQCQSHHLSAAVVYMSLKWWTRL